MPLVPAKCPNCGASLTLEPVTRASVCRYCQTPFVVEDAVNNYNIQNTVRVEHLHTDKVEIQDSGAELFQHLGHRTALNQAANGAAASRSAISSILRRNASIFAAGNS